LAQQDDDAPRPRSRNAGRVSSVDGFSGRAKAQFNSFDTNRDGVLTPEEQELFREKARRLFNGIDSNGDGVLSPEEQVTFRNKTSPSGKTSETRKSVAAGRRGSARGTMRSSVESDGTARRGGNRELPPDHADVKYGPHTRNTFDLWLAEGDTPAPLVIHFHQGGFRKGDKKMASSGPLPRVLLEGGVSYATANYRLSDTAPFPAQMHDGARVVQFIRLHASKFNIDPSRIGASGRSAGAGIALWLAFHDDLADSISDDLVLRQSSRIRVAAVGEAPTSFDPRFYKKLFDTDQLHDFVLPFFGMKTAADIDDPKFHKLFEEASPINHASPGDPPVMVTYIHPNTPLAANSSGKEYVHHPRFGLVLKEKLDSLGIECVLELLGDRPKEGRQRQQGGARGANSKNLASFLFKKLGVKEP